MRTIRSLIAAAVVAGIAAPLAGQAAPHPGLDAMYREFMAGYASLEADRVAGLYVPDAIYASAGSPVRVGREEISRGFHQFFDAVRGAGATLQLRFRIVERRVSDGAAWELGYYHLSRVIGDSVGPPSVGRFVTGARRGSDGRWRFVTDSFEGSDLAAWTAANRGVEP